MGRDKFAMDFHGLPQYAYLYCMMSDLHIPVYLSCSAAQSDVFPPDYKQIVDRYDGIGPIGGLASAIEDDSSAAWLVVACDLIHLNKETIQLLLDSAATAGSDIVTFKKKESDYYETTLSVYTPATFHSIRQAIDKKNYSLQSILKSHHTTALTVKNERVLTNANTPEDLI